ncbi:MAG: Cache 3/Cache 2 fusion domain-containing protein [Bacteroidales bacterium]
MTKIFIPLRLRLFLPVSFIITIIVIVITVISINKSINIIRDQIKNNLELEAQTLKKMFEREASFKLEKVKSNLKVASAIFYNSEFTRTNEYMDVEIQNQITRQKHLSRIEKWKLNGLSLYNDNHFVDSLQNLFDGTITVFQKVDSGFVRISTNVMTKNGNRAVDTFIPNDSPVTKNVMKGETYYGRAFVVNDWYITAYEPIVINDEIIGMIYVGDKEKDLNELKNILYNLEIGKSGYPFVFDKNGYLLIHPDREGEYWADSLIFCEMRDKRQGYVNYELDGESKVMAFVYFEPFELYIAASIFDKEETYELKRDTVIGSVVTAVTVLLLLLGFIYYFTTDRIYRFFTELQKSQKKLDNVRKALEESEERFKKLFDSTGDDIFVTDVNENIVEVNKAACETLGYSREELLNMKITDIKSDKVKDNVAKNRKKIFEQGSYSFESEHITKTGELIQVEFISRLVRYGNEKLILSVVRNISRRIESERQILSAVIKGEERERERFAKEMHDGLGPLLSTIKLYVNELDSISISDSERKDLIKHSNELIDEAVSSTRTISNNLMPTVIHSYGLIKAVQAFCDKVNKTNKLNISFETEYIEERLDSNLELIFFRVISELINNTIKHAKAKNVYILLTRQENRLILYFRDDGVGFVVDDIIHSENRGMGLKNIISRIKSINGKYNFSSAPGKGFTLKIEISL